MSTAENLMSSGTISSSLTTIYQDKQRDVWQDVFPFEIILFRSMLTNGIFMKYAKILYALYTLASVIYIAVMLVINSYVDDIPFSLIFLIHLQGITFLVIPYMCHWFLKQIIVHPDLNHLIAQAVKFDSRVKIKFALITHFNFLCLLFAALMYHFQDTDESATSLVLVFSLCVFYLGPLNVAACLAVCVIELHRIKIQQFRQEINDKRTLIDFQYWNKSYDFTRNSTGETKRRSEVEMNFRHFENECPSTTSGMTDHISDHYGIQIRELHDNYYQIIYLGEYPTNGLVGFVLVGLFVALSLGAAITACNETGHLVCRDLSSYLISLPHHDMTGMNESSLGLGLGLSLHHDETDVGRNPSNNTTSTSTCYPQDVPRDSVHSPNRETERERNSSTPDGAADCLRLLSAMAFMKLQICYFGNMALRSSLSFAILGSLLVAVIPVLIEKEG